MDGYATQEEYADVPVVTPVEVEPTPLAEPPPPPTNIQLGVFLTAIRRIAPLSARRVVELIDEFALHYYPDGIPEPPTVPETPAIETFTDNLTSADLMALALGRVMVSPDAGGTIEFLGGDIAYTFGTLPYVAAGGNFSVRSQGGATISGGCAGTGFIDQSVSGTGNMPPLGAPWNIGAVDAPLELAYLPTDMTGGDGGADITISYRKWPAGTGPALDARSIPPYKFGVA